MWPGDSVSVVLPQWTEQSVAFMIREEPGIQFCLNTNILFFIQQTANDD